MLKSIFMVACEKIIRHEDDRSTSVIGILDTLRAPVFPVSIPRVGILSLVEREPEDPERVEVKAWVERVNGERASIGSIPVDFNGKLRHRLMVNLVGLQIGGPGMVVFTLDYQDLLEVKYSVNVESGSAEEVEVG